MSPKPPYRVPGMAEVAAIPWNGYRVASTFSGCGGSCLGYRMAGFRVVWASEFVPIAQESYRANMEPGCILDGRDIRQVQPGEILVATGLKAGELDAFDGSPPCQAFSTAGKREKGWGQDKRYEHGARQKNETLFTEYIRLLRGLQPKTFVAENVSGLAKGVAKGYFIEILRDLKASGYRVVCRLLDAQWLGVPQTRQRLIFVGVREDLGVEPTHPAPLSYRYSVADAIWDLLPGADRAQMIVGNNGFKPQWGSLESSTPTIITAPHGDSGELRIVCESQSGFGAESLKADRPAPTVSASGQASWSTATVSAELRLDASRLAACDGKQVFGAVNPADADRPCPTVQTVAHDTPFRTERRKFTIAELRRICAFPDDFILKGSYAQQWERLGNAVPPLMMRAVAEVLRDRVLSACKQQPHA